MPELPDITVYVEALERRVAGEQLTGVRVRSPFLVRTVEPVRRWARGLTINLPWAFRRSVSGALGRAMAGGHT